MRTRHLLTVQPREQFTGSAGQKELRDVGEPVEVRGNVHPLSAEEIQFFGERSKDMRTFFFFGPTWPADMFCSITFKGEPWDQAEPEKHFDIGTATQHFEVIIRKR